MDLTKLRGLWIHEPSSAMGHLHEVQALGFDYVLVKVTDGRQGFQPNTTRQLIADALSIGLTVVVWAYVYPGEAQAQAQAIANFLPRGCKDVVLDAEVEFEGCADPDGEAGDLVHAVAEATGHSVAIHLSSFWSPEFHPKFPFRAFLSHCAAVGGTWMPQAYFEGGSRTPESILDATMEQAKGVLASPAQQVVPTINAGAFCPILKAKGIAGFNVWSWDPGADAAVASHTAEWASDLSA